jgi:hypothetical protein
MYLAIKLLRTYPIMVKEALNVTNHYTRLTVRPSYSPLSNTFRKQGEQFSHLRIHRHDA